jgi:ketosteroid isomerase-like protein
VSTNVDIVRAFYAAWNSADRDEATAAFLADDFEYVNPDYAVEPGTRRGLEGWRSALANLDGAFDHAEHRPGDFVDLGDKVLCYATFVARTGESQSALERDEPQLWTLRDGKISRFQWFHDRDEARAAAGIATDAPE